MCVSLCLVYCVCVCLTLTCEWGVCAQDKLDFICESVKMLPPAGKGEANLPALTGIDRGQWAEVRFKLCCLSRSSVCASITFVRRCWAYCILCVCVCVTLLVAVGMQIRELHFAEGINRLSLDEVENSILVLNLDDNSPTTWTVVGSLTLHGNGNTR